MRGGRNKFGTFYKQDRAFRNKSTPTTTTNQQQHQRGRQQQQGALLGGGYRSFPAFLNPFLI
jgi:hypothetical protein